MIAERWEQIKALFEDAFDRSPEERQKFLKRLSLEDPEAAREVVRLLQSYEEAGEFLLQPCTVLSEFLEGLEQHRFAPGEVLCDRFRIIELIGQGGMGEVYKAWDEDSEDYVALKTLRSGTSTHELFTIRFRREIQLARKVTHPNVCRIFDSFKHRLGEDIYLPILSMELLQGQTLAEYLKDNGKLSAFEALPIARQIISGLNAIHAAGIIHRDLKPGNLVMVPPTVPHVSSLEGSLNRTTGEEKKQTKKESHFQIKITDFGIAGKLPEGVSAVTYSEASKLLGTPDYMAPEQLEHGRASIQSDIYSLGLILYRMITGSKPFEGLSAWRRISADPPSPCKVVPELPDNWEKAILCCLEPNPEYRFQSADAVLEGLEGVASPVIVPHKPLHLRLRRAARSKAGVIAIFFLVLVALAGSIYRIYRLNAKTFKAPEGSMLLLMDITNKSSDPKLARIITDVLRNQLSQSAYLTLLDDASIRDTLRHMARPTQLPIDSTTTREVAMRSDVPLVVTGSISQSNGIYRLDLYLELVGNEPERPINFWNFNESAPGRRELLEAVNHGSIWIRRTAGEASSDLAIRNRRPEDVTTDSWEALQLYSEGQRMASESKLEEAVQFFKMAISKDEKFAMAWMRAGDVLDTLGNTAEGLKYWEKALEVSGLRRLSQREELRIKGMYASDTGDFKTAADYFTQYSLAFPNDYLGYFNHSYTAMVLGNSKQAIQLLHTAEKLSPNSYYIADHLARYNLIIADFAEVDKYILRLRKLGHNDYADQIEGQTNFLKKHYDIALQLFFKIRSSNDAYLKSVSYYLEASVLAEQGKYAESIKALKQGIDFDLSTGDSPDRADKLVGLAYLYLKSGKRQAGRDAALQALEAESGPRNMVEICTLLARAGWISEARQVRRKLDIRSSAPVIQVAKLRMDGELLLAQGYIKRALTVLQQAKALDAGKSYLHDYWPHALLVAGQTHDALKEFESLVSQPGQIWQHPDRYPPGYFADLDFVCSALELQLDQPVGLERLTAYLHLRESADFGIADVRSARQMSRHFQIH